MVVVKTGTLENTILSPEPTPAPVALLLKVTVVPVEDNTVVLAGITVGAVRSKTTIPATTQEGVVPKCRIALPEAVVLLVAVGLDVPCGIMK